MNRNSSRSKALYLPKFPRLQRLLRRREIEETEFTTFVDSEFLVHVRPNTKHVH